MTIKPIPGADQPLTLDAIRERDRWADQVPAEGGITSAQRAMDRRWLLAEVDRLRAIEASFVAVHSHRVGDASPETAEPCGEPGPVFSGVDCEKPKGHEGRHVDALTSADASRPGLTEEQAREMLAGLVSASQSKDRAELKIGDLAIEIREPSNFEALCCRASAIQAAAIVYVLRASRGETGPAPTWGELAIEEHRRAAANPAPDSIRPSGSSFDDAAFSAPRGTPSRAAQLPDGPDLLAEHQAAAAAREEARYRGEYDDALDVLPPREP